MRGREKNQKAHCGAARGVPRLEREETAAVQALISRREVLTPSGLLQLQRTAGNAALAPLLLYEQHLDRPRRVAPVQRVKFRHVRQMGTHYTNEEAIIQDQNEMTDKGVAQLALCVKVYYMKWLAADAMAKTDPLNAVKAADRDRLRGLWSISIEKLRRQDITISDRGTEATLPGHGKVPYDRFDPAIMQPAWAAQFAARQVKWDRGTAQDRSKVLVSGGTFTWARNHSPVDTTGPTWVTHFSGPGYAIFVMSSEADLHVASHKVGKYHHSSLLAGVSVASAGEMKLENGRLKFLSNKSGHYQPTAAHLHQILYWLVKKGGLTLTGFDLKAFLPAPTEFSPASTYKSDAAVTTTYKTEKAPVQTVADLINEYGGAPKVVGGLTNLATIRGKPPSFKIDRTNINNIVKIDNSQPTYAELKLAIKATALRRTTARKTLVTRQ
jgi:hypothetical protein